MAVVEQGEDSMISNFARPLGIGLLLLVIMYGCFRGTNLPGDTGTVRGKIVYKNGSVPEGSVVVMVHQETGIIATGMVNGSGNFFMQSRGGSQILVGKSVVNIKPPGDPDETVNVLTMETVPDAWKSVPQKYWTSTTSPERYVVQPGSNDYEFILND